MSMNRQSSTSKLNPNATEWQSVRLPVCSSPHFSTHSPVCSEIHKALLFVLGKQKQSSYSKWARSEACRERYPNNRKYQQGIVLFWRGKFISFGRSLAWTRGEVTPQQLTSVSMAFSLTTSPSQTVVCRILRFASLVPAPLLEHGRFEHR